MRSVTWLAGLGASGVLALAGAVDGCSSSSDHPPVLGGTSYDSGHGSSSSGGQGGSSSGSSSGGGPTCLTDVDAGCTDLGLCGAKVVFQDSTMPLPTPQGGTILPGTYVLTQEVVYGTGGGWARQSWRLTARSGGDGGTPEAGTDAADDGSGGDGSLVEEGGEGGADEGGSGADATTGDSGGADAGVTLGWESISMTDTSPLTTVSGTITVSSATTVDIAYDCPSSGAFPTSGYTATATTFTLIVPPGSNNPGTVVTFTKQ